MERLRNIIHAGVKKSIELKNEEMFDILLPGADLNLFTIDDKLDCPLFHAVYFKQESMAMKLLQNGCPLGAKQNRTFVRAISHGFSTVAMEMIKQETNISFVDKYGQSPLLYAVKYGLAEVALELIKQGCVINAPENHGWNALMMVPGNCDPKVGMELIEKGCDVNQLSKKGDNALTFALKFDEPEIALKLIEVGCDFNQVNDSGYHALHFAAEKHPEIALILIQKGCDLNQRGRRGSNALMNSIHCGHSKVALELIEQGCDLNEKTYKLNCTALSVALRKRDQAVVKKLVESGCNLPNEEEPMVKNIMTTLKKNAKAVHEVLHSDQYIYEDFPKELMPFLFRKDVMPSRKRKLAHASKPAKKKKRS